MGVLGIHVFFGPGSDRISTIYSPEWAEHVPAHRADQARLPYKPLFSDMAVGQNPVPLVNITIGGKWMFIHPKWSHRLCPMAI